MHATSTKHPGSVDVLEQIEVPVPEPKQGELLIKVHTAAVNRADVVKRGSVPSRPPYPILGVKVAGEVVENRSDISTLTTGTKVHELINLGGCAEYAVMPADRVILLPDTLDYVSAAGTSEVFLTTYQTLYWLGELQEGETVLTYAGANGVGTAAIQLARRLSHAKIIVTAGSEEKLTFCEELGTGELINYKKQGFQEGVRRVTDGRGIDVILNFIGASYWKESLASIAVDGRWVLIGMLGGATMPEIDLGVLTRKHIQLLGTLLTPKSDQYKTELIQTFMGKAGSFLEDGRIRPIADRTLQFSEVKQAHEYMEANKNIGRIILKIVE